jgi:putative ABC transport system substrate-binding protein
VGAVCGKAARTDLGGGRAMKRTSLPLHRRKFISLLGGAAVWPVVARAQQPAMPVIGFLSYPASLEPSRGEAAAFRQGLKEAGYIEGRNVAIELRLTNTESELPALAADLVHRQVAVIAATGSLHPVLAAKAATSTIPIVYSGGADLVRYGLAASLNRPGGNVTGIITLHNELASKRLDLLRELVPQATTVGYLAGDQGREATQELTSDMLAAARALERQVIVLECRNAEDFEPAFATLVERGAGALLVSAFPLAFSNRGKILAMAAHHKIPAIYSQSPFAYSGGLMSYSAVVTSRELGSYYVPQILKGAKPAELPIQGPTKFRLVINLKTAKALGLEFPSTLLALADEVIE